MTPTTASPSANTNSCFTLLHVPEEIRTELLANTNWAHHGEKDTRFSHTDVDVKHCDRMVDLFETFAQEYDEMLKAITNLEKVVATAGDDVVPYDAALAAAKKARVADDHNAVQLCQKARDAAARKAGTSGGFTVLAAAPAA